MKNNKGFSLVELIIVIAIMAILVGVMAPQLIKYIEKTNVSSDKQLCDSVRTAVTTAIMDPDVISSSTYEDPTTTTGAETLSSLLASAGSDFSEAVTESLGVSQVGDVAKQLKSHGTSANSNIEVQFVSNNSVVVFIPGTDASGNKKSFNAPDATNSKNSCIYAGPAELL